jgi:hypothetical protein
MLTTYAFRCFVPLLPSPHFVTHYAGRISAERAGRLVYNLPHRPFAELVESPCPGRGEFCCCPKGEKTIG